MTVPAPQSRNYLTLEAISPKDGKLWEVRISTARIEAIGKRTKGQVLECAYVVPQVLKAPTGIFEGLRKDEDEAREGNGWLCYVGVPKAAYAPDGRQIPPWPGKVFLVFLNQDRVAYGWRWEKCDPSAPTLPDGHGERFKRRLL